MRSSPNRTPGGRRTAEIAGLAGVSRADSFTFVFGGLVDPASGKPIDSLLFSGTSHAFGAQLVAGRDVDPTDAGEFVASRSFVDATGAALGDRFRLLTLTPEQAAESGFAVDHPDGPESMIRLVGVIDSPQRLDDPTPVALVSPALLEDPNVGIALTMIAIDLDPDTDIASVRAGLDTLADSESLSVDAGNSVVSDTVRRAVATQARGLWLLAVTTGIAGIIVVGQVLSRQVRPSHDERHRLAAIGFTSATDEHRSHGQSTGSPRLPARLSARRSRSPRPGCSPSASSASSSRTLASSPTGPSCSSGSGSSSSGAPGGRSRRWSCGGATERRCRRHGSSHSPPTPARQLRPDCVWPSCVARTHGRRCAVRSSASRRSSSASLRR